MMNEAVVDECGISSFSRDLDSVWKPIKSLLVSKNAKYGNSALEPVRIFSKANATEQIKVRLDDKLSRLANQQPDEDEDVVMDLIGYLILMKVAELRAKDGN